MLAHELLCHCMNESMEASLRIVVVASDLPVEDASDEQALALVERTRALRIGLLENGFNLVATLPADVFLAERIEQLRPDLIVVDAESDARDALEHVVMATRDARRPIVLFTDDNDTGHMKDAVALGVSAYVVDGLEASRIRSILDVAMARFQHEQALRAELALAQTALQQRDVIEQAKLLLMRHQKLSEPQAHSKLRKMAMDRGMKLAEIAQKVVDMADLLA
jgi:response regulator NasT